MMVCLLLLLCLGHCLPAVLGVYLSIDCHAGGTVMLPCYGEAATDTKEVDVLWKLNGWPACWFKNGEWCENSHLVNRAQLGSIRQNNFSLIINTVRNEDEGVYTCEISEDKKQTIHLVVKGRRLEARGCRDAPWRSCLQAIQRERRSSRGVFRRKLSGDWSDRGDCNYCSHGGGCTVYQMTVEPAKR
nr:myosin light chain kinase, smooth muscle-like isoform X1 [Paramormyrops kingsleyae]